MQMDFGLLSLAYCPLLLSPSFLFSIVSIAVPSQSCQLPNCDLFTLLALLLSFGRETSLVKITGPRSIFTSLFTPLFTFCFYFHWYLFYLLRLILCTCWEQSYLLCAGPGEVSNLGCERRHCSLYHLVYPSLSPTGSISTLASSLREIAATLHLKPSTWGNQRGARSHQSNFWHRCQGLKGGTSTRVLITANFWHRCRTPVYKIGELHAIFYLCFLVLLVYLSVFTFVSLIKNTKNTCCYYGFQ